MSRQSRIRHKPAPVSPLTTLTRQQAIRRVAGHLKQGYPMAEELWPLVHLFGIHTEELSEAGVGFEQLRALEAAGSCLLGS
ncbi:MAG: hypothetical protein AB7P76_02800 [Candidatus Melainabacteria bacterium]